MARPESGGLGLRVDADNVVSKIISGGAAAVDGRLRLGDRILAVNGQSLKGKKLVDKRHTIKDRDQARDLDRRRD